MSKFSPWLSLVAIIWLQSITGTNTSFPAYSSHVKSRLAITQVWLNNLAVASDIGKLFGWCSGIAINRLPLWSVLMIGSTIGFIGYGFQFLFLAHKIATVSYWLYFLLQVLAGNSICCINTVCYVTALRKFPDDHAIVIALATSYTGLSAKIYIAIAQVVLGPNFGNRSIYVLLNCVVPMAFTLVSAPVLTETGQVRRGSRIGFLCLFVLASVTGVYAVVETAVLLLRNTRISPTVLLILVGLVAVAPFWKNIETLRARYPIPITEIEDKRDKDGGTEEHSVLKLLGFVEFWMFFLVYLWGAGLVYVNNLGQIAQSRGVKEDVLLSIFSLFRFFGKLASAPISALARNSMLSRPASVAVLMVPMACSFFLLLSPNKACMFISTAIIGLSSGAITSTAVSMTCDLFGTRNFSVNHNIVIVNIPAGSLLFGYIAALIYDRKGTGSEHEVCMGIQCYSTTFIVWGSICTFGTVLSFILYFRTRKVL